MSDEPTAARSGTPAEPAAQTQPLAPHPEPPTATADQTPVAPTDSTSTAAPAGPAGPAAPLSGPAPAGPADRPPFGPPPGYPPAAAYPAGRPGRPVLLLIAIGLAGLLIGGILGSGLTAAMMFASHRHGGYSQEHHGPGFRERGPGHWRGPGYQRPVQPPVPGAPVAPSPNGS